jgi:hypothetical protein
LSLVGFAARHLPGALRAPPDHDGSGGVLVLCFAAAHHRQTSLYRVYYIYHQSYIAVFNATEPAFSA